MRLFYRLAKTSIIKYLLDSFVSPSSPEQAMADSRASIDFREDYTADEAVQEFINGPRWLSDRSPLRLVIIKIDPTESLFMFCLAHWHLDGVATISMFQEYLKVFGEKNVSDQDMLHRVGKEWTLRWGRGSRSVREVMPCSAEDRLPRPRNKFQAAGAYIETHKFQERYIVSQTESFAFPTAHNFQGGHVFPRNPPSPRNTAVANWVFDKGQTKKILARCRKEGVTIIQVVFVLCNIAWIHTYPHVHSAASPKIPMMVYSSINHRPHIALPPGTSRSQSFIALAYYNIILPTFFPKDLETQRKIFWWRCRDVREQTRKFTRSKLFGLRAQVVNKERAKRAMRFAQEDDEIAGIIPRSSKMSNLPISQPFFSGRPEAPPSVALMGVSTVNDLDAIFKRGCYPDLRLTTLNVGTRKARGGILLYAYTFNEEFTLSLGWDKGALKQEAVSRFWGEMKTAVETYLLDKQDQPAAKL